MEAKIGLSPDEMMQHFNRMFVSSWERNRAQIDWEAANISQQIADGKEVDISQLLMNVSETIMTSARDGFILAMYLNNDKIAQDLLAAGIELPLSEETEASEDAGEVDPEMLEAEE